MIRQKLNCTIAPETMAELMRLAEEQQSNLGRVIDALVANDRARYDTPDSTFSAENK